MKNVYLSYVCGYACIREMGTDVILKEFKGKASYEVHSAYAKFWARKCGWTLV